MVSWLATTDPPLFDHEDATMTASPPTRPKITYATAQIDSEQLDLEYEAGLEAI